MPRVKKTEAVIPTNSLVASAVRYSGRTVRVYQPSQDWQAECYRHYSICGEARFAASFMGHALSRAVLKVMKPGTDDKAEPGSATGVQNLNDLFNGRDGQAQMLNALGVHLTIAGECYLVGRARVDTNDVTGQTTKDVWEVVSVLEMKVAGNKWTINYGDGMASVDLTDNDVVLRIWTPNPGRRIEADSPFRSLLPILTEIEWLTRHIFAQVSSRLTGAGILFVSQGMSFPPPPAIDGIPQEYANEADGLMLTLADALTTPLRDPGSPTAVVPTVVAVPEEILKTGKAAELMHFWSNLDEKALEMRNDAVRRFALGMDMPPEQVLGMGSNSGSGGGRSTGVSHWGAWQIEEATIKMHVEPMLHLISNAITIGYLRPLDDGSSDYIEPDTSALRLRPDRSKEALELYDRGLLSNEALLRETGFEESDLPPTEEFRAWLLRKIASGSATPDQVGAAARLLGVDLGPAGSPSADTREARPAPTLEEHPTNPRTPDENAALLAASNALVYRALERAGNRIRQSTGVKPPGVPSFNMHTLHHVNGTADKMLDDAWASAPQVLDGIDVDVAATVAILDSYVRSLFATQEPHSRERMCQWLRTSA